MNRKTPSDSRLLPCNAISELSPLLCNTSSEAVALLSEVRNESDRTFSKLTFFNFFFLETNFSFVHVSSGRISGRNMLLDIRSLTSPYLHSEGGGCRWFHILIENVIFCAQI